MSNKSTGISDWQIIFRFKDACLDLELTVKEEASILGAARHTLSRIINGQSGISPEMAIRLEKAFGYLAAHAGRL